MTQRAIGRPAPSEYAADYGRYLDLVPHDDIIETLEKQMQSTLDLLSTVSEERASFRYAPDKWSIKEVVGHIIDSERVFAYRALVFARADLTSLPGFEQDDYVRAAGFDRLSASSLTQELALVRAATLALFKSFDHDAWQRWGKANGVDFTVRAVAYIIAGHERHHVRVLQERYLAHLG